jgi:PKD repeat protein
MSGTSMAAPHVAGAAAVLASSVIVGGPSILTALTGAATDEWSWSTSPDATDAPPSYPLLDVHDDVVFKPSLAGAGDPGGGDANVPPTASFSFSCTDLACAFDGTGSSDSDGSIASYDWDFGDGNLSTGRSPSHTYVSGDTYTVTLTVTDNEGVADTDSQAVIVSEPSTGGFSLTANGYKVKGVHHVDLSWDGATTTNVDIYRNGSEIATTTNDGAYTDDTGNRGGATYTYQVCEAGTGTCSNAVTVEF